MRFWKKKKEQKKSTKFHHYKIKTISLPHNNTILYFETEKDFWKYAKAKLVYADVMSTSNGNHYIVFEDVAYAYEHDTKSNTLAG